MDGKPTPRVRHPSGWLTGRTPKNPTSITAVEDGIKISFSVKLDRSWPKTPVRGQSIVGTAWGPMYGSPEVSALNPDVEQIELAKKKEIIEEHDEMVVNRPPVDGKTVHLKLKNMQPVMQMHVHDLESTDGDVIITDIWNTVHELGTTNYMLSAILLSIGLNLGSNSAEPKTPSKGLSLCG